MAARVKTFVQLFRRNIVSEQQFKGVFQKLPTPKTFRPVSSSCKAFSSSAEGTVGCSGTSINEHTRLLRVALIGEANSGKSTLTNRLVGNQVSVVTHVPHTTRQRTLGVYTQGNSQLVLLDTPGVVTVEDGKRLRMTKDHMRTPANCLEEADLVAVLCDSSNKYQRNRIHHEIINLLQTRPQLRTILVLNKIDNIKHKFKLLHYSAMLTNDREKDEWGYQPHGGLSKFEHVFMVSALTGDGIEQLRQYMVAMATPGQWEYSAGVTTDLDIQEQIAEVFRGKLLSLYKHEIPWQTKQVNIFCEQNKDGVLKVHQKLFCRRDSQRRCILEKVDELQETVKHEIESMLNCPVELTVEVGVSKAMINNPFPIL